MRRADPHPREPAALRRGRRRGRPRWSAGSPVGDPSDPATEIGPLVAKRQQERVEKYIALGQEEGARVVVGGNGLPQGIERGWYVQPTVFADVTNDMRIAREEIFGPVLAVIPYDDVRRRGPHRQRQRLRPRRLGVDRRHRPRAWTSPGACAPAPTRVNQYTMDFIAPFGGYKASGIGREFGREGLEHYLELKSIIPPGGGIAAAS